MAGPSNKERLVPCTQISRIREWRPNETFDTADARIGFLLSPKSNGLIISMVDLFHGKMKNVLNERDLLIFAYARPKYSVIRALDEKRFLLYVRYENPQDILGFNQHLFLIEYHADKKRCQVVAREEIRPVLTISKILLDYSNNHRFVLDALTTFIPGHCSENGLTIARHPRDDPDIVCLKLDNGYLHGIQFGNSAQTRICSYDMANDVFNSTNYSSAFPDGKQFGTEIMNTDCYQWAGPSLYVGSRKSTWSWPTQRSLFAVYCLDSTNGHWSKFTFPIQGFVHGFFFDRHDDDGMLTIHTNFGERRPSREWELVRKHAFHRCSFRRPDTLSNLVWRSIRSHHVRENDGLYERALHFVPKNSHLSCKF